MVPNRILNIDYTPTSSSSSLMLPSYFRIRSIMLLALLVYVNTSISFNEMGSTAQLMAGIPLIFWWFVVVGIRIDAAIFAAVALTPSTLLLGFGYFKLPSIALTLSDIFTLVAMCIFLVSPQRLQRKKFNKLIWLLLATCTVSIFFAANPIAHFGQLIRLGFSVGLISIVLSSRTDNNNKGVFFGMMLWPIIVMAHLAGVEGLWRFISFDNMAALNSADTGEVLLGSHMVVQNLFFLIPLLLFLKLKKVSIQLPYSRLISVIFDCCKQSFNQLLNPSIHPPINSSRTRLFSLPNTLTSHF